MIVLTVIINLIIYNDSKVARLQCLAVV